MSNERLDDTELERLRALNEGTVQPDKVLRALAAEALERGRERDEQTALAHHLGDLASAEHKRAEALARQLAESQARERALRAALGTGASHLEAHYAAPRFASCPQCLGVLRTIATALEATTAPAVPEPGEPS